MVAFLVTALSVAAVLTPIVASVSLVYRVSGVVNFGGGFIAVFGGIACAHWGSGWAGVALTLVAGAVIGALCYFIAIVPARRFGVRGIGLTLSTLGFGLLLTFVTRSWFGGTAFTVRPWLAGSIDIAGFQTSQQRLLIIGLAIVVVLVLFGVFDWTLVGRRLSAVSYDAELASVYGIRGGRYQLLAWVVSGLCLVIGGMFEATLASVDVEVAPRLLVLSLVGAVIGGLTSLTGAIGGALVAAVATTISDQFVATGFQMTALLIVLSVVLLVRPNGLFSFRGTAERL